jgi:hypothetical protein
MQVEVSQYCFELEDMSSVTPFWEWLEGRIQPEMIYTEPKDFEAILNGLKKIDNNKYLIIGELDRVSENLCKITCSYNGQTEEIITVTSLRLSDHRFKMEISFWEPEGWPKEYLWEIFNNLLKDLSHDYPDVKKSLRNSILGFKYEDLDDKQKSELFGIVEDHSNPTDKTITQSVDSLLEVKEYLLACIAWADRPEIGGKDLNRFLDSTFGTTNGYPDVSRGRFYRYLQKAEELGLIKKEGRYYKLANKNRAEALKRLDYIIQNWNSIRTQ